MMVTKRKHLPKPRIYKREVFQYRVTPRQGDIPWPKLYSVFEYRFSDKIRLLWRKLLGQEGLGLAEAMVSLAIMFVVLTTMLSIMVASEKSLNRAINYHAASEQSDSTVSILAGSLTSADYSTSTFSGTSALYISNGKCYSWELQDTTLVRKTWMSPDTAPADFTIALEHVTQLNFNQESNLYDFSWSVKPSTSTPTVKVERSVQSTGPTATPSMTVDPFGEPSPAPATNPCS